MPRRGRGAIVIVGAGLTGGTAAKALRKQGYAGELLILTDEPGFPFGRPPLTKGYLRGEENLSGWMVSPLDWYKTQNVQVVPAKVTSVEARARRLKLESGETIAFDRLLVATGGRNRPIDVPGAHLSGIYQLRTIAECDAIKRVAKPGSRRGGGRVRGHRFGGGSVIAPAGAEGDLGYAWESAARRSPWPRSGRRVRRYSSRGRDRLVGPG